MKESGIAFVKLDILENWRFWNTFKRSGNFEAAGREVIAISEALLAEDYSSNETAAKLLRETIEFLDKKKEAGRKGGLAKAANRRAAAESREQSKEQSTNPPPPLPNRPKLRKRPLTADQVYDFAADHDLDQADARNWFEQNFVERPGCDKDGEVIRNWQGALINSCKAAKKKREKENETV